MEDLLDDLSSQELTDWIALAGLEPWDEELREDIRHAQLCALLVNVNRGKGQRAAKVEDFLPDWYGDRGKSRKATTPEQMALQAQIATAVLRGAVKRRKN